jgi:hypothetical protein
MTQTEFEQLPKQEQNFRWALFLKSNGYEKTLTAEEIDQLRIKHIEQSQPVKI